MQMEQKELSSPLLGVQVPQLQGDGETDEVRPPGRRTPEKWAQLNVPSLSNSRNASAASFDTQRTKKSVLEDCVYEITVTPQANQNKLPPVSLSESPRDASYSLSTPRTPHVTPRTPPLSPKSYNLDAMKLDEKMIRKRTKEFFVYDLLMEIRFDNIVEMRNAFAQAGGGVSMAEFVTIMKDAIPHKKENEPNIISRLCDLFAEIDIDNDKEMTWEEFTSFIIKSGVEPYDPTAAMKRYQEIIPETPIVFHSLFKLKYFPQIDRIIVCENSKDSTVKLYRPENAHFKYEYNLVKELHSDSEGHTGGVLCAEYIDSKKYLITSGSDSNILGWDAETNYRERLKIITNSPQLCLVWSSQHNTLFSGDCKGIVHAWNVDTGNARFTLKGHTDMVTSLVALPNTLLLASSSLDSTILIWDVNTGEKKRELRGHIKGVFSLAYSHEHRFLMSAGSDRDALVWNPMVKSKPIFRLKGHHSSLVGIEILEGTPQVITCDLDGVFKLWDIRTFECTQSFESSFLRGGMVSFCSTGPHNQIVAGGSRLIVFEYDKPGIPWLSMDTAVIRVLYNSASHTILTAGADIIKIWDAKTGRMLRMYTNVCDKTHNDSISAVCLDSNQKKIFVGDTQGNIKVLNYTNGAVLRTLDPHNSVVSDLIYCPETNCIISSSWDNTINIHDELDANNKGRSVLRSINGNKKDVTAAAYSESLSLIASGTAGGIVWVWDFDKCGFEAKLTHEAEEITSLIFMYPYAILCRQSPFTEIAPHNLFSADNKGKIILWTVKPAPNKYHQLLRFENVAGGRPANVHSMAWSSEKKILYTGDERGQICAWNFSKFFKQNEILPVTLSKVSSTRKTVRYGDSQLDLSAYRAPTFVKAEVALITQWRAHYSTITSLTLAQNGDEYQILSSSNDKRVRCWSPMGDYCGTLRQAPGGGRWNFKIDNLEAKEKETKKVNEVLSFLQKQNRQKYGKYGQRYSEEMSIPIQSTELTHAKKEEIRKMVRAGIGKSKFAPNTFYQYTQARMRTGDPNLNKFNPNILNPSLLPDHTAYFYASHKRESTNFGPTTYGFDRSGKGELHGLFEERAMTPPQIQAAQRLSQAFDNFDEDELDQ